MGKKTKKDGVPGCELAYAGKEAEETLLASVADALPLEPVKTFGGRRAKGNLLIHGDNLAALKSLVRMKRAGEIRNADGTSGVRLVYIDPPFSTNLEFRGKKDQKAYKDKIVGPEFIEFLRKRLILLRELLSPNGSIFVHLDWKKAHHIKVVMDEVFGEENFLNDIIWSYGGRGAKAVAGQFSRNHDIILWYGNGGPHIFNQSFVERRVRKGTAGFRMDEEGRWFKTAPRGDYTDESVEALRKAGRVHETRNGKVRIKYFLREDGDFIIEDRLVGDVWDDIPDAMHMNGSEKTGYPTQKPEGLLARVISTASNEGDIVLDAFAGAGTTLAVAERLNRKWIGMDSGSLSIHTIEKRLLTLEGSPPKDPKEPVKKRPKKCSPFSLLAAGGEDDGCGCGHGHGPAVESVYSIDEEAKECVVKIKKFSCGDGHNHGGKGLEGLSSVMLDYNFDSRAFRLDRAYFAEELKELGYTIRIPLKKVRGTVMFIYSDIFGNESWFAGEAG